MWLLGTYWVNKKKLMDFRRIKMVNIEKKVVRYCNGGHIILK